MALTTSKIVNSKHKINSRPNMGETDRMVRGAIGSVIFLRGLSHRSPMSWIELLVGGASLLYALQGQDPVLRKFGLSTVGGANNNILTRVKDAIPGQGINPSQTEQPSPKRPTKGMNQLNSLADALAIH